jgi:2-polyprenyl-3-methyl-5-hydroxy-6-metoxy-1,4-benzoquinol methylase
MILKKILESLSRKKRRIRRSYKKFELRQDPDIVNVGHRAVSSKTGREEQPCFKKKFDDTEVGRECFDREVLADKIFGDKLWKPPIINKGELWFEIPYFDPETRLDRVAPRLDDDTRLEIAKQAISLLFDIFFAGYAHRDFHAKNLFWEDRQLKLVDFEFLIPYPEKSRPPFPLSYDISGEGLESPQASGRMGYARSKRSEVVLEYLLDVSADRAIEAFKLELENELRQACQTFKTKKDKHICKAGRIYSSFQLPFFSVAPDNAQRDSDLRLHAFKIQEQDLLGKNILDLGSNIGGMLFAAQQYGAAQCLGVEYDSDKVLIARKIAAYNGLGNVDFVQADIDELDVSSVNGPFDIVFCLAIDAHVKKRDRLFNLLFKVTGKQLYFEGNNHKHLKIIQESLIKAGFNDVKFLGPSNDDCIPSNNRRPLFSAIKPATGISA